MLSSLFKTENCRVKVNLPRYEKRERLCLSLGTSDYLRTVGVTSVLAHCTVIHSDCFCFDTK